MKFDPTRQATREATKYVRKPKCVRLGIVKTPKKQVAKTIITPSKLELPLLCYSSG